VPLNLATLPAADRQAAMAFQKKVQRLRRAVSGTLEAAGEAEVRFAHLRKAILDTPSADPKLLTELQRLQDELNDILLALRGDPAKSRRNVFEPPAISNRVDRIANALWTTTSAPTTTQEKAYRWAGEAFSGELERLGRVFDDLRALEDRLEEAGAPWTPGRLPRWTME